MKSAMRTCALVLVLGVLGQVQAVLVETKHRRKGRLECPPGPEPCTCNCAAVNGQRQALSNLMTQALPGGPPPPPTYPQLPAAPPPLPPPPPAAPRAPPLPPPPPADLPDLPLMPDVTPEDLPTLGPAPTRAPPLYPCNLEQAKIAPWLLRLPCNLTAAPESLMTPPAVVSPEKIPEDRPFPFPMQPQMPSMPGAGNLAKLGNNLPGANMMNAGLPTAPTVPSMPRVPTMPGVPTVPTAPSMPAMPGAFLEKSAKVEKKTAGLWQRLWDSGDGSEILVVSDTDRSLRAGNQAIREAGDAEMTCDCEATIWQR